MTFDEWVEKYRDEIRWYEELERELNSEDELVAFIFAGFDEAPYLGLSRATSLDALKALGVRITESFSAVGNEDIRGNRPVHHWYAISVGDKTGKALWINHEREEGER